MAKRPHRVFEMYDFRDEALLALTPKSPRHAEVPSVSESWTSKSLNVTKSTTATIVEFRKSQSFGDETVKDLRQAFSLLTDKMVGDDRVLLDFTGVESFAAASIDLLVQFNQNLRHKGSRLVLCCLDPGTLKSFFVASSPQYSSR